MVLVLLMHSLLMLELILLMHAMHVLSMDLLMHSIQIVVKSPFVLGHLLGMLHLLTVSLHGAMKLFVASPLFLVRALYTFVHSADGIVLLATRPIRRVGARVVTNLERESQDEEVFLGRWFFFFFFGGGRER